MVEPINIDIEERKEKIIERYHQQLGLSRSDIIT